MSPRCFTCFVAWAVCTVSVNAATLNCDLSQYQPLPGLTAVAEMDELAVQSDGEGDQKLRARFGINDGVPTVRELSIQSSGSWKVLGRDLTPEFRVTTGIRRTN